MGELRDGLDWEARRVSGDREALGRILARARRRRTARRVAGGVLALAIAGAGLGVAYGAFRGPDSARPAVGPTPTASPPTRVRLLDGADDRGAIRFARGLIREAGFRIVEEGSAGHAYETTTIACPSAFDHDALEIERLLNVEASIVGALPHPDYDLTVYIGDDLAGSEYELLRAGLGDFINARRDGDAEGYLATSARGDYFETSGRTEPLEGELYLYPEEGIAGFQIAGWRRLDSDIWHFAVFLRWKGPCGPDGTASGITEQLTLRNIDDGRYEVMGARYLPPERRVTCS
jgi:LytR cell envelope-related transcriptional attenuator